MLHCICCCWLKLVAPLVVAPNLPTVYPWYLLATMTAWSQRDESSMAVSGESSEMDFMRRPSRGCERFGLCGAEVWARLNDSLLAKQHRLGGKMMTVTNRE